MAQGVYQRSLRDPRADTGPAVGLADQVLRSTPSQALAAGVDEVIRHLVDPERVRQAGEQRQQLTFSVALNGSRGPTRAAVWAAPRVPAMRRSAPTSGPRGQLCAWRAPPGHSCLAKIRQT